MILPLENGIKKILQRAIQIWQITEADGVSKTNKTNRPNILT
jgi:hypothetical protein